MLLKEIKGSELRLIRDNNNNRCSTELIQTSQPKNLLSNPTMMNETNVNIRMQFRCKSLQNVYLTIHQYIKRYTCPPPPEFEL
jgi:hypothetical protein